MTSPGLPLLLQFRPRRLPCRLLAEATAPLERANSPENSRLPERNPITQDRPAGRSWMERIGSHSVVVVLLLVVVAAGLVIGRNSRNQGLDSSLADSSDLLDFDEGTELDLPLPKHVDNQPTEYRHNRQSRVISPIARIGCIQPWSQPTR